MDARLVYLKRYIDAKEVTLLLAYAKNKRYAFWHNVGVTALGAVASALIGLAELDSKRAYYYKGVILILTMSVTIFVACDQFFRFRSKSDAHLTSASTLSDLRDEIDSRLLNPPGANEFDDKEIDSLLRRARAAVKDANLLSEMGSVWRAGIPEIPPPENVSG